MLPRVSSPVFDFTMPSTGKKVDFRPFTVKEEKILLFAKESGDKKDILNAFKQIIRNCILQEVDVDKMPIFDLEYAFLKIRSKSSNNITEVKIIDQEDEKEYVAEVDIDEAEIIRDPNHKKVIDLDGNVGVVMRYPTVDDLDVLGVFDGKLKSDGMITFMHRCIDEVYDSNNSYKMSEATEEEKNEFFESLTSEYTNKIQQFFTSFPIVKAYAKYKKNGEIKSIELTGAHNFL